jgi:peptide/nickel transport system permease protein
MADIQKINQIDEEKVTGIAGQHDEMQLDDARRIKVLSPGMLVFKRFIRNQLAVVGFAILFFMFTFSFLGPVLSPYSQIEVFKGPGTMTKDFAGATYNQELRYAVADGEEFGGAERAQFLLALGKNADTFNAGGSTYYFVKEGEQVYRVLQLDPVAEELLGNVHSLTDVELSEGFIQAYRDTVNREATAFDYDGVKYRITKAKKASQISTEHDVALASLDVYDAYDQNASDIVGSYEFKLASTRAIARKQAKFFAAGENFIINYGDGQSTVLDSNGKPFAEVSNIIVNPIDRSLFLPVDYKAAVRQAIANKDTEFTYVENGEPVEYTMVRVNTTYNVKKETTTELIRQYEAPSETHLLGLDNNGMDVMTRLMYGGRVSLLVGFVVIFIEVFLGIIVGGISGYFGGPVDTALMRFVDLFNSIPFWPVVLIFGSVMDALEVLPMVRIFLLMGVLGILGWTGVARIVRGQILSLREQDFMVATEAQGIRTSRRIFRHLVPNVMPLLIVQATAGLGGIIITEATLGFLGLGIKYPLASWGSIINVASDAFVMTNYWFMWIPAGLLILLTVLGFNFVGDGLRDAYDPKMQR